jgi:hypothetical protein
MSALKSGNSRTSIPTCEHPAATEALDARNSHEGREHNESSRTEPAPWLSSQSVPLSQQEGRRIDKASSRVRGGVTSPGAFCIRPQDQPAADTVNIVLQHRSSDRSSHNQNPILIQGHLVEERADSLTARATETQTPAVSTLITATTTVELVDAQRISDSDDAGNRRMPRRRQLFYRISCVVTLILLGMIGLILGLSVPGNDATIPAPSGADNEVPGSNSSSASNETRPSEFSIESFINFDVPPYSRQAILANPESPQARAIDLLSNDPQFSSYPHNRRLTRFALATFYYAMNRYSRPDGRGWNNRSGWASNATECSWYTTAKKPSCSPSGRFISLTLEDNGLRGYLPLELELLSDLQELRLPKNQVSGTIPGVLGTLDSLTFLDLSFNLLTGATIPSTLGSNRVLTHLSLQNNKLVGTIPPSIFGMLSNGTSEDGFFRGLNRRSLQQDENEMFCLLEYLNLDFNRLTGSIPSNIIMARNLQTVSISDNRLEGTIPENLVKLSNLCILGRSPMRFQVHQRQLFSCRRFCCILYSHDCCRLPL